MKKLIIILTVLSLLAPACTMNNNLPLTPQEKESLSKEVFGVMNSIMEGMKNHDVAEAFESNFLLNVDFKYVNISGEVNNAQEFLTEVRGVFDLLTKTEINFSTPDINIVSNELAIVTLIYNGTFYFPDYSLSFPDGCSTLVLRKTKEGWKGIHFHESWQEADFVISEIH